MGATAWRYYTAYREDPEEALQALRAEVFARGEYVDLTGSIEDMLRQTYRRFGEDPDSPAVQARIAANLRLQRAVETGALSGLSREDRAFAKNVREFMKLAAALGAKTPRPSPGRRPQSIEELLEWAAECGTHSILDIEHVGRRPGFGLAAPVTSASLKRNFGTAEPTHVQVEERWSDIADRCRPWQARYLPVYLDGCPHEYAFIGCSGD